MTYPTWVTHSTDKWCNLKPDGAHHHGLIRLGGTHPTWPMLGGREAGREGVWSGLVWSGLPVWGAEVVLLPVTFAIMDGLIGWWRVGCWLRGLGQDGFECRERSITRGVKGGKSFALCAPR